MLLSKTDFLILAGILSGIGSLGIYEDYTVHPVFYSQAALLFVATCVAGHKVFIADRKTMTTPILTKD